MGKYRNEDAFYERMRNLANINESKTPRNITSLGNLVDYKRGADKVAYGIVQENHHYFIKKSNNQSENPLVEDFAYIGGLANITEYRYNKLSEAEKVRNMMLHTINEALGVTGDVINESGVKTGKQSLTEGKESKEEKEEAKEEKEEGKEHEKKESPEFEKGEKEEEKEEAAEEKKEKVDEGTEEELGAAEAGLDAADAVTSEIPDVEPTPEPAPEVPAEPDLDVDAIDLPPAEGGDEAPAEDVPPAPEEGGEEAPAEEPIPDGGDGEDGDLDENNREIKKMVGKIGNLARTTEMTPNQVQDYVNSFLSAFEGKFSELEVEERNEMADKITKVVDGEEELEADMGAEQEVAEESRVCNECGFAKFAESMGYDNADALMECGDAEKANLMSGYMMEVEGVVPDEDLASMAMISNDAVVESLVNEYGHSGLVESLEPYTNDLNESEANPEAKTKKIEGMFWWQTKPQDKKDTTLKELSEEEVAENMDAANTMVQPELAADEMPVNEDDDEELEGGAEPVDSEEIEATDDVETAGEVEPEEISFGADADVLGAGVPKPDGADTTTVEIEKGSVTVTMNESERKLRNYIRTRLEEKAGKRKPMLNEDKKSSKLKTLDKMIDAQFDLFESVVKKEINKKK